MTEHKLVLTKYMRSIASVLMADPKVKSLTLFFTDNTQGDWRAELLVPIQGQDCLGVVHMSGKHLDATNEDTPEHLLNLDAALLGTHISRITMVRPRSQTAWKSSILLPMSLRASSTVSMVAASSLACPRTVSSTFWVTPGV